MMFDYLMAALPHCEMPVPKEQGIVNLHHAYDFLWVIYFSPHLSPLSIIFYSYSICHLTSLSFMLDTSLEKLHNKLS